MNGNKSQLNLAKKHLIKLFYLLGFITYLPLFINASDLSFIFLKYNRYISHTGFDNDIPIPIGWLSITLFFIIISLRNSRSINYYFFSGILLIIFNIFFHRYLLVRTMSILYPFLGLIWTNYAINNKKEEIKFFCKGFIHSITLFLSLNFGGFIISNIFNRGVSYENTESVIKNFLGIDFNLARQMFSVEIYQYYISVASIFSLISGIFFIIILNYKKIRKYNYFIFILSSILSTLTLRKIVLIENIAFTIIGIWSYFKNPKTFKNLSILFFQTFITIINFIFIINTRIFTVENFYQERNYFKYLSILKEMNLNQILFGFKEDFGGLSNTFLELIYSSGIIGLFIYISSFVLINLEIINSFKRNRNFCKNVYVFLIIYINLLLGNLINLNFTQPYYVCNFLALLLLMSNYREKIDTNNKIIK